MSEAGKPAKLVPEWKRKLRVQGRWSFLAAFFGGIFYSFAKYGIGAASFGSGIAYGLMLGFVVMLLFGLAIIIRGLAEPPRVGRAAECSPKTRYSRRARSAEAA